MPKELNTGNNSLSIRVEDMMLQAMKLPIVKISRESFLRKELIKYCPENTLNLAIKKNPAYAGIEKDVIGKISRHIINYETNKVSAISFAAGIPGGIAMIATVPADVAQYFAYMLRVMQKLAYLYGFDEFALDENEISDETMNQLLIFLGVMFGVQGANAGVKLVAGAAAQKVTKTLANKALTKTTIYPIVKKIALKVGLQMNKQIFAKGIGKIIPVVGGFVSGGLSYATFKPCAKRLEASFKKLPLCDPQTYKN